MRKCILIAVCILFNVGYPFAQNVCQDPNPIRIITDCGTIFDLCLDNYGLSDNQQWEILNVFSNDEGLFDPCQSDVVANPSEGQVYRISYILSNLNSFSPPPPASLISEIQTLNPCLFVYRANTSSGQLIDQFNYSLVVNDKCSNIPDYCTSGSAAVGKIWTIYSQYLGSKSVDSVQVWSKKQIDKPGESPLFRGYGLVTGDYFFVDGTGLSNGDNSEWTYRFFYSDNSTQDVGVHTSCSAPIFGLPHPVTETNFEPILPSILLPVSGCVSANNVNDPLSDCITTSPIRGTINTRAEVTSRFTDTTVVTITRNIALPITLSYFTAVPEEGKNVIDWKVETVTADDQMFLEKSYDGRDFFTLDSYDQISESGIYRYDDLDIGSDHHYYRLRSVSYNGVEETSEIVHLRRQGLIDAEIFPNPTSGLLYIRTNPNDEAPAQRISIYDYTGKMIHTQQLDNAYTTVELRELGLTSGIYLIGLETKVGNVKMEKVMVR